MSIVPPHAPIVPAIRPFPFDNTPYTNVTPLTIRDNMSIQWSFEAMKEWIRDSLVPHTDAEFSKLVAAWLDNAQTLFTTVNEAITDQAASINGSLNEQRTAVNEALAEQLADVTGQLTEQNAAIAAQLSAQDAEVSASVEAMTSYVDQAVQSIINSTIDVSDPVVTGIIDDLDSTFVSRLINRFSKGVRPELYGAVGDGVTNDSAAFAAMLAAGHKDIELGSVTGYLVDADVIQIPMGGSIRGTTGINFLHGDLPDKYSKLIIRSNSGSIGVYLNTKAVISDVAIFPENYAAINFSDANYPGGTGNVGTGLYMEDRGCVAERVTVAGFSLIGIDAGTTNRINSCYVRSCPTGYRLRSSDGFMFESVAMFCYNYGIDCEGSYWRYVGNRIEWNARVGLRSRAHATIVGNLFDRNGHCGLFLNNGSWGQIVTGNHFSRNGAGGDGTNGRWGYSIPGHASYVETAAVDSCHIKINSQRAVTITGNRFSVGRDDSGTGMQSPAYIYSSDTTNTAEYVIKAGNAGEFGLNENLGYVPSAYSGVGAIAGGTDAALIASLSRKFSANLGVETVGIVKAPGYSPLRSGSALTSSAYNIDVEANQIGMLLLSWRRSDSWGMARVYFGCDSTGANKTVTFENVVGSAITGATIAANGTDLDRITISATGGSRSYNYLVEYAAQRAL
jgi:hypothetical protein